VPVGQNAASLCIKGPNVMTGYYNQPAETAAAFTADGFMRTGDIAVMQEDGYSRIVDRKKDMILVSGFNVFPNELENVISLCPGVVECAAIGVPDEKQGEAIKVFVVRKDPTLTEEAVLQYCNGSSLATSGRSTSSFGIRCRRPMSGRSAARASLQRERRLNEQRLGERRAPGKCRRVRAGVAVFQQHPVCRRRRDRAVVDTGYVTHADQTLALIESVLGMRPLDRVLNTHLAQ
jgi:acyl-CoA synthetase (AMP-forming)/AMP-acid ligase II